MCYLMRFHNPTGRTLNVQQRRELIEAVASTDVVLVEDEYQHSLRCRGSALPTLRSMDPRGRTLTVSTVSKELFPALRIGWIAGDQQLLEPMAAVKRFMDLETSPLLQAALVEFMQRGSFDRHLTLLRDELQERHAALQTACSEHLPTNCRVTNPDGGFVAWLEMPEDGQGDQLAELAAERGVRSCRGARSTSTGRVARRQAVVDQGDRRRDPRRDPRPRRMRERDARAAAGRAALHLTSPITQQRHEQCTQPNVPGFTSEELVSKIGFCEQLKGGVIMDVVDPEQAQIAEEAGPAP